MKEIPRTTTDLMHEELEDLGSFDIFDKKHKDDFVSRSLTDFILKIIIEKNLRKSSVIKNSGLDRTYGYQIFNGRRNPNRKNLIQLSFGLGLNSKEAEEFFKTAGHAPLYPKIKREAAAIYCLNKGYSYLDYTIFVDEI